MGDPALERALLDAARDRRARTEALLARLVAAPSLPGEEGAAQDVMEAALGDLGLAVDRFSLEPAALRGEPEFAAPWLEPRPGRDEALAQRLDAAPKGTIAFAASP